MRGKARAPRPAGDGPRPPAAAPARTRCVQTPRRGAAPSSRSASQAAGVVGVTRRHSQHRITQADTEASSKGRRARGQASGMTDFWVPAEIRSGYGKCERTLSRTSRLSAAASSSARTHLARPLIAATCSAECPDCASAGAAKLRAQPPGITAGSICSNPDPSDAEIAQIGLQVSSHHPRAWLSASVRAPRASKALRQSADSSRADRWSGCMPACAGGWVAAFA